MSVRRVFSGWNGRVWRRRGSFDIIVGEMFVMESVGNLWPRSVTVENVRRNGRCSIVEAIRLFVLVVQRLSNMPDKIRIKKPQKSPSPQVLTSS